MSTLTLAHVRHYRESLIYFHLPYLKSSLFLKIAHYNASWLLASQVVTPNANNNLQTSKNWKLKSAHADFGKTQIMLCLFRILQTALMDRHPWKKMHLSQRVKTSDSQR